MSAPETPDDVAKWFDDLSAAFAATIPIAATYGAAAGVVPLDLRAADGVISDDRSLVVRVCAHCHQGIAAGERRVNHLLTLESVATDFYHRECVIVP